MNRAALLSGPGGWRALRPRQRRPWRVAAGGSTAGIVALVAAAVAVTGGAGEQDARSAFVLEPQVRYVSEFTAPSAVQRARPPGAPIAMRVAVSAPFIWPVEGAITSRIGSDHPSGIDIGLSTDRNREIKASAAGTVSFSGGSDGEDYGFHIIIDHGDGVETLYAHLSQRVVQAGAVVQQGQLIGIGGSSGKSDGIHLHFEVTKDGRVFNPLDLLPDDMTPAAAAEIDCRNDALVMDAGSRVTFDLAGALAPGESVVGLTITDASGAPADAAVVDAGAKGTASLDLWSQIEFEGPVQDDAYVLAITTSMAGATPEIIQCAVTLHTPRKNAAFYVRSAPSRTATPVPAAGATGAAAEGSEATEEPFVLPTNTPLPIFLTPLATAVPPTATPTKKPATATPKPEATPTSTPVPGTPIP